MLRRSNVPREGTEVGRAGADVTLRGKKKGFVLCCNGEPLGAGFKQQKERDILCII